MKVYLVDFENVKSKGLAGVDKLTEYDRVIIFYSENADTINFEMHQKVMMSKADVEYFKVNVGGKNALDFQLSTLLGYLVATKGYSHLFVISNDKSFDFLHDFWHGKYITSPDCIVYRTRTIAAAINYSGAKKVEETVDELAEEDELLQDMLYLQAAVTIPQAEPSLSAPQEVVLTARGAEADEAAQSVTAEEKTEEKRPKLDDSELFEYYQQFFNNAKADAAEEKSEVKADKDDNEKPLEEAAVSIETIETAGEQPVKKTADKKSSAKARNDQYMKILSEELEGSGCTQDEIDLIAQLLKASETKEEFHNNLAKEFKQQATELYKSLRPKYLRLKEKCASENAADEALTVNGKAEVSAAEEQTKQEIKSDGEAQNNKPEKKTSGRKKKQDNVPESEVEAQSPETENTAVPENTARSDEAAASPRDRLALLLDGICTDEELDVICELFDNANTKQQLYIRMVKAFKKDKGCKFYNAIKSEYSAIKN